jgi:hypothetical protein
MIATITSVVPSERTLTEAPRIDMVSSEKSEANCWLL